MQVIFKNTQGEKIREMETDNIPATGQHIEFEDGIDYFVHMVKFYVWPERYEILLLKTDQRDYNHSGGVGEDLFRMDEKYSSLVHQPPALVGTSYPGMVLRGLRADYCGGGRSH